MIGKVVAKSASDKTDDWPFWMLWDGSINVTNKVGYALFQGHTFTRGEVFVSKCDAEWMAEQWNAWPISPRKP